MRYKIQELLSGLKDPELKEQYTQIIFTLLEKGYFPGLAGVPVVKSSISYIDGEKGLLTYRGYPVQELAGYCSYEDVCYLLLNGDLPLYQERMELKEELLSNIALAENVSRVILHMDRGLHPMYMLGSSILLLQADDKECFQVENYNENYRRAIRLIAKLPSIIGVYLNKDADFSGRSKFNSYAEYCLSAFNPELAADKKSIDIFQKILILHADHTLNNSTFSVRAVGSSKASIYASIASALNSLSGPLHGGANERVIGMLKEIGSEENVPDYINKKLAHKEKIMGIGHRVYQTYDPRSLFLKEDIIPEVFGENGAVDKNDELYKLYKIATRVEEVALEKLAPKNVFPNVDFWSGLVLSAMGIKPEYFTTIFALGRVVGWAAHWLEHMEINNRIFRPKQLYNGIETRHILLDPEEEIASSS